MWIAGNSGVNFGTKGLRIQISLANNLTVLDRSTETFAVPQKLAAGTLIGSLSVTDVELSDTHTLELVFGTGSTDNDRFVIVGNELRLAETLDFELQPTHSIRVRATDNGGLSVRWEGSG